MKSINVRVIEARILSVGLLCLWLTFVCMTLKNCESTKLVSSLILGTVSCWVIAGIAGFNFQYDKYCSSPHGYRASPGAMLVAFIIIGGFSLFVSMFKKTYLQEGENRPKLRRHLE